MKSETGKQEFNPMVELETAFNSIGASLYQDEFACELLAWFHICGASNEAVVLDPALSSALLVCARKIGFEGGKTPDARLFGIWKAKVEELREAIRISNEIEREAGDDLKVTIEPEFPAWLKTILDRYKLRQPKKHFDF